MGIDIGGNILEGTFISRINRFKARVVVDGKEMYTHVPNTGRMKELLNEGTRIFVRKVEPSDRKTNLDLLMAYKGDILTCIDSRLPNDLIYNEIKNGAMERFKGFLELKREVVYKNSRFDLYVSDGFSRTLIEIKCVTLFENKIARFPDAPTERGRKHIKELMDAKKNGIDAAVIFVVFSNDALFFRPNDEMDKDFGRFLREAYLSGVSIHAYSCSITPRRIELDKRLFVLL
jgi:sugar fermentation stimulation protein